MPSLDARGVASLLREYAQRTALRGGNPYRAKAYSRAADSLAALAVPLDALVAEDRLAEIGRWRRCLGHPWRRPPTPRASRCRDPCTGAAPSLDEGRVQSASRARPRESPSAAFRGWDDRPSCEPW
ncbi:MULTISPECIES: hypothetical protein [Bradyrhizobium]|uniref:hypothetical protein n=1 Tax=Bradyrhizobium sp. CCBAU 11434 TaxID=1630885 RepID=UPI003FA44BE0